MNDKLSLIFYVIVFCIAICIYSFSFSTKKFSKITLIIFYVFLVFIIGMRFGVGTDYWNYAYLIKNMQFNITEPINMFLFLPGYITQNSQLTFSLYTFFTLHFAIKSIEMIYEEKKSRIFCLIFYLFIIFPNSLNTVRESLAIVILLYSYTIYFKEKNLKKMFFLFLISCMVHNGCILCTPIILFLIINKHYFIFLPFIYLFILFICTMMALGYLEFLNISRLNDYFAKIQIDWGFGILAINIPWLIFYFLILRKKNSYNDIFTLFVVSAICGIIMRHLSYINFYFYRTSNFFSIANVGLIGYLSILFNQKNKFANSILFSLFLLFNILFFYYFFSTTGEITHYQFSLFS